MVCADVGEANADIAGIGVVTAFAFQAISGFILSIILHIMQAVILNHASLHAARPVRRSLSSLASLRDEVQRIEQDLIHSIHPTHQAEKITQHFRDPPGTLCALHEHAREKMQNLVQNMCQELPQTFVDENIHESRSLQARSIIADIVYFSSDVQTLAGIALALVGIIRRSSLSLYQLHLIYDTINLTSISNCAALISASAVDRSNLPSRVFLMAVFGLLYFVFVIIFGVRLGQWDDNIPGRCYNSRGLALPDAHHPYVDKIYLGITCMYMFCVLFTALRIAISRYIADKAGGERFHASADRSSKFYHREGWAKQQELSNQLYALDASETQTYVSSALCVAMLQLPLHLYFIIRLRLTNEPLLSNGNDESKWGFGQIHVLITSAGLIVECCKGCHKYWTAIRQFKN